MLCLLRTDASARGEITNMRRWAFERSATAYAGCFIKLLCISAWMGAAALRTCARTVGFHKHMGWRAQAFSENARARALACACVQNLRFNAGSVRAGAVASNLIEDVWLRAGRRASMRTYARAGLIAIVDFRRRALLVGLLGRTNALA